MASSDMVAEITAEMLHDFTVHIVMPKRIQRRIKLAMIFFYVGAWVLGMGLEVRASGDII